MLNTRSQGLAEGYYKDRTGKDVNTKARYNYAEWCGTKGNGIIPAEYRQAGAAVFWSDGAASVIHHVAFLVEPVDANKPTGDWYLVEARSVLLGVCKTKLLTRKPNFWGLMTKYYDYEDNPQPQPTPSVCPYLTPIKVVKRGQKGDDVKWVQWHLVNCWDVDCLPKFGIDGDFGSETERAVKAYQRDHGLKVDGKVGAQTGGAMIADEQWLDPDPDAEVAPDEVDNEDEVKDYEDLYVDENGFLGLSPEEAAEVAAELARSTREGT